ncbi:hypothetical protein SAMN05192533_101333 [Mesobacillus persicus]|uniref:Uncharacterized protein n=1 Tax=Mesobacillus persicus TaxID=930146 RepID=A0A1H7WA61_9BACI|nr:hypothetical protein [Mesobacillus persicus]SEM18400.1 hypothetical protein SAMN05192533_101333 [Mesobacillus persicus]
MDLNLFELEYMMHAKKTKLEKNIVIKEVYKQNKDNDENRKKYSVRVLGLEFRI